MTRDELYALVWSKPMSALAEEFRLSGRGLAKICERANIPVPPRGYWAKKAAGRQVEQPSLPEVEKAWQNNLSLAWPDEDEEVEEHDCSDPPPSFPNDLKQRKARARQLVREVPVGADAPHHPEIRRVALVTSGENRRRVAIANAVFLTLERIGVAPRVLDPQTMEFSATVEGTEVRFALTRQSPYVKGLSREEAADMLSFKLRDGRGRGEAKRIWNEHSQPLEEQLIEVVVGLLVAAEEQRREAARDEHRRRRLQREQAAADAERRRRQQEAAALRKLESDAKAHRVASDIRALIQATLTSFPRSPEVNAWSQMAAAHADRIDPVANGTIFEPPDPWDDRFPYDDYRS